MKTSKNGPMKKLDLPRANHKMKVVNRVKTPPDLILLIFQILTWNTDAWGYGPGTTSLYQSHPWVLAVLPSGETLGVLADTTHRCEV